MRIMRFTELGVNVIYREYIFKSRIWTDIFFCFYLVII